MQGLITHEMTHAFAFDLIPRGIGFGLSQRAIPLWVDEGLADYFRGAWDPLDLMMIRDAALTDKVPRLSRAEFEAFSGRLVYNMGHACFEFIEARYGKEGIRQFLYTMRKGILGGGPEELFKQAFRTTPEEFDAAFDKWLKERFKPYRDKQRPDDFGHDLSPNPEKTSFTQAFAFAPSPSGEIAAIVTANRNEGEADVVLVSTKDGTVIKNLTGGFDTQWESFAINREFVAGRSLAFDPQGDHVGFFGRTGKGRSFFLLSVLDGGVKKKVRIPLDEVQAPCLLGDGKTLLVAALHEGVSDIWRVDLDTGAVTNLTQDEYADNNPQVSPDGKVVVYERRISGHWKIYAFPLAEPSRKTQLTFGPFNDQAPFFSTDGTKVYYASDEDEDIPNLRSLDLQTGAIAQFTDVFGGTMAPAPLHTPRGDRLAFITYYKGEYKLHTKDTAEPVKEVEQDVRAAAEGLVDFQPDVTHEVVPENKRRKKLFEGLYLEGRPPINVGVTSSGDFFGGTAVALTDTLGDQLFSFTVLSVASYRIYDGRYTNLASRLHYGINFYDQTYFFYPYYAQYSQYYGYNTRDLAIATQRFTGGQVFAEYPLDTFRRIEIGLGVAKVNEQYGDQQVEQQICQQNAQSRAALLPQQRLAAADLRARRAGDDALRRVRAALRVDLQRRVHLRTRRRQLPAAPDGGRGPAQVPAPRPDLRPPRRARARLLLDRRQPRLLLLRRQHGAARLPVLQPRGQPGLLRQRRAAPAAHPPRRDPDRHPRPAARHGVLRHRRRPLQGRELQVLDERSGLFLRGRPDLRRAGDGLAAAGRPRVLRLRPSALLPRLPSPLRLDEVHGLRDDQQGLGLRLLDRVRLLGQGDAAPRPPQPPAPLARVNRARSAARCL